jgi:hypothetical protein
MTWEKDLNASGATLEGEPLKNQSIRDIYGMVYGVFELLRGILFFFVLSFFINLMCAGMFWDQGILQLEANINAEIELLKTNNSPFLVEVNQAINKAYQLFFIETGLERFLSPSDQLFSDLAKGFLLPIQTFVLTFNLIVLRLSVLFYSGGILAVILVCAFFDGLYGWLMRRINASREHGFLYHRSKRLTSSFIPIIMVFYVLPPIPIDPRYVLIPVFLITGFAFRQWVHYFKRTI